MKNKIELLLKSEWTKNFYEVEDVALHESEIRLVGEWFKAQESLLEYISQCDRI